MSSPFFRSAFCAVIVIWLELEVELLGLLVHLFPSWSLFLRLGELGRSRRILYNINIPYIYRTLVDVIVIGQEPSNLYMFPHDIAPGIPPLLGTYLASSAQRKCM